MIATNGPRSVVLLVRRGPRAGRVHWDRYEIEADEPITAFMALRSIYERIDSTLAFRNYTCWRGTCGSCEMTIDNRRVKGCLAVLKPGQEYSVAPVEGCEVLRDLFVPGQRTGSIAWSRPCADERED